MGINALQRLPSIIKTFSRQLRREMTDAERHFWRHLKMRQLGVKFRRQHPCDRYILDFACTELKLAIELDGGQHAERKPQDTERTRWLESQGWQVLRFWNNDVMSNVDGVLDTVVFAISHLKTNAL